MCSLSFVTFLLHQCSPVKYLPFPPPSPSSTACSILRLHSTFLFPHLAPAGTLHQHWCSMRHQRCCRKAWEGKEAWGHQANSGLEGKRGSIICMIFRESYHDKRNQEANGPYNRLPRIIQTLNNRKAHQHSCWWSACLWLYDFCNFELHLLQSKPTQENNHN